MKVSLKKVGAVIFVVFFALLPKLVAGSQSSGGLVSGCHYSDYGQYGFPDTRYLRNPTITCDHIGAGWGYFKYDIDYLPADEQNGLPAGYRYYDNEGNAHDYRGKLELPYAPWVNGEKIYGETSGTTFKIDDECIKYGGFYHYGYTDYKWVGFQYNGNRTVSEPSDYIVHYTGYGLIGSPQYSAAVSNNSYRDLRTDEANKGPIRQVFVRRTGDVKEHIVAHLVRFEHDQDVYAKYGRWIDEVRKTNPNVDVLWRENGRGGYSGTLSNFCYGPSLENSPELEAETYGKINGGDEVMESTSVDVGGDGSFKVSFKHNIKRASEDSASDSVSVSWWVEETAKDGRNRDIEIKDGRGALSGDEPFKKGETRTVVNHNGDTITGTLLPGEERTYCQHIHYKSGSTEGDSNTVCLTVRREAAPSNKCKELTFSVSEGWNWGIIRARKNSSSWQNSAEKPDGSLEHVVNIWTKPGDIAHFQENMCEYAEPPNQYYGLGKDIAYTINATNDEYKQNLAQSSWNNSQIKDKLGEDIWGGQDYSKTTESPDGTKYEEYYKVNDSHLGGGFFQGIDWTDLHITNGGAVDQSHDGSNTATAKANVNVPYNYRLAPSSSGSVYALVGSQTYTVTPTVSVEKRVNKAVDDSEYATATKPTKYQLISYIIDEDANGPYEMEQYSIEDPFSTCRGDRGRQVSNCRIERSGENQIFKESGKKLDSVAISIDENTPLGSKICTVLGVWPADSHNNPTADKIEEESSQQDAMDATENKNNRLWAISKPTCATVAKRPNFQAYNYGVYAEQGINTSVSDHKHQDGTVRRYGSWSEFEVVSVLKPTLGLASGATLWGGAGTNVDNRVCDVSSLTFTNYKCNAQQVGGGHVGQTAGTEGYNNTGAVLASSPAQLRSKIESRYTRSDGEPTTKDKVLKIIGGCEYKDGKYIPVDSNRNRRDDLSFECLENGAYYTRVKGDAETPPARQGYTKVTVWVSSDSKHSSNTFVVHVDGTLDIKQDFYYGELPHGRSGGDNTTYSSVSEIPQVLFIAKNIRIAPEVTHLDAWLIADDIDTCYPGDNPVSVNNCDTQLTVTGPVISNSIALNRTAGGSASTNNRPFHADTNWWINENSKAAEVFRVSPFAYLWSFNQAQRYSQAFTTYSKELPTRY